MRGRRYLLVSLLMWVVSASCIGSTTPELTRDEIYSTEQIIEYVSHYPFTRDLKQWHIHHTWDPSYADFNGGNHAELQEEMRKLHVEQNGWDDIGQHLTLFPDGTWMIGRSLDKDPASIRGWNQGAIAVEMVGNFDIGHDEMTELQKHAIYRMTRFMVHKLQLEPVFHHDHPKVSKTCPGSGIDREQFMSEALGN